METPRRDGIARSIAARFSRRTAVQASGIGLAAGLVATSPLSGSAREATPDPLSDDATVLFVQSATSGTFAANPLAGTPTIDSVSVGGGADYLLTLEGHTGNTIYFSDRPERIFGEAPTQAFLDGLGFQPDNPPNAALVTNDADGNEDILVVELLTPSYDADAGSITYGANILTAYEGSGLAHVAGRQRDEDLAPTFGEASLFIDDCPDITNCYNDRLQPVGLVPGGPIGLCWVWSEVSCQPCDGQSIQSLNDLCTQTYPDDCVNGCVVLTA